MHKAQKQVQEFHRAVLDGPTSPAEPKMRNPELRAKLILEEAIETVVALVGTKHAVNLLVDSGLDVELLRVSHSGFETIDYDDEDDRGPDRTPTEPNLVEAIDGIVDTIYVCYGTAEDLGIDLEPFFDEVHASNMRKRDPEKAQSVSKSPVGKVLKPEGWTPPDIAGVLKRVSDTAAAVTKIFVGLTFPPDTTREHKICWVYDNLRMDNPNVTREMVERAVDDAEAKK